MSFSKSIVFQRMQIFPSKGSIPDNCHNDKLTSFLEVLVKFSQQRKLRIFSHLSKKPSTENFIFCSVTGVFPCEYSKIFNPFMTEAIII